MRVLLLGATGLIGSAIAARLTREGIAVSAVVRAGRAPAADRIVRLDLRAAVRPEAWRSALEGVNIVVNAAGVVQDNLRDSTAAVHEHAPAALFEACRRAGVRRFVQISAMVADKDPLTAFARTKRAAERTLMDSGLDWVILRPAVVVGSPAYGGSALLRALAALPLLPVLEGAGRIQLVQLEDLAETVVRLVGSGAPHGVALEIAAPETMSIEEVVARYRRWLGWRPARLIHPPPWLTGLAFRLGDLAGRFGWRPPIRSTARLEMARGAVGDPSQWTRLTGIVPCSLDEALAAAPASVQERWFARLYLLKPLILLGFALFWMASALVSLGAGFAAGEALVRGAGAGPLSGALTVAGALADLAIGLAMMFRPTAKAGLLAALAVSILYLAASSLLLPRLWADPLGPLVKILPILLLNLVALAILDDR